MSDSIYVRNYWPNPNPGKIYSFHYVDTNGSMPDLIAKFVLTDDQKNILYVDYDKDGKWKDTWYLQWRDGFGLAEWRDDYPMSGIFGSRKKVVFSEPIGWGNYCEIGKLYENYPKTDIFACWPPNFMKGTQSVIYESKMSEFKLSNGDTYSDVVTCVYQQSFGSKTAGARYYLAKGIGPIAVQWIAPDPSDKGKFITTSRMDATYTVTNGRQKDIQT